MTASTLLGPTLGLHLLPLDCEAQLFGVSVSCIETLNVQFDLDIFAQFREIPPEHRAFELIPPGVKSPAIATYPLPPRLTAYIHGPGCAGLEAGRNDKFGRELTYAFAGEIKRNLKMPARATSRNRAIKAYIDALDERTPIILFWC
jgi:hypothetical protein